MPEAVLVSAVRTPVGRAPKGALSTTRPDDLAALAVGKALDKVPALDRAEIEDVILGCAQPEGEQGWDIARWVALRAGLPVEIPGATVNRLCASGLEAIALADLRIRAGMRCSFMYEMREIVTGRKSWPSRSAVKQRWDDGKNSSSVLRIQ